MTHRQNIIESGAKQVKKEKKSSHFDCLKTIAMLLW